MQSRGDVGVLWNCRIRDPVTVQVTASIDDAQSRAKEVEEAVGELVRLVGWLGEEANWEWGWRECGWWVERLGGRFPAGAAGLIWELTPPPMRKCFAWEYLDVFGVRRSKLEAYALITWYIEPFPLVYS